MIAVTAVLVAKLLDPALAVIAIAGAWFYGRGWASVLAICLAAAFVQELLLMSQQLAHTAPRADALLIGLVAALIWALATIGVRRLLRQR